MGRTRGIKCPRCHGEGSHYQKYSLMDRGGGSIKERIDCLTCDGEGRLGPVIVTPTSDGKCACCRKPTLDHVCVTRGPIKTPLRPTYCATDRKYFQPESR